MAEDWRFDIASSWAEKAFRDLPGFLMVVGVIAASHALAGRTDEARRAMDHLRQLDSTLRISTIKDWLPIRRPEDLAAFADRWPTQSGVAGVRYERHPKNCIRQPLLPLDCFLMV
jgi:hypothetical protein